MSYYKNELVARARLIQHQRPDLTIETWMDYGFRLDVIDAAGRRLTVMQPDRADIGQPEINLPVARVLEFFSEQT